MLNQGSVCRSGSQGVTLIELLVGMAIFAILMLFSIPAYQEWIQNVKIRTMADGLQNGLQIARNEAVKRNQESRFQLVSSMTGACALSATGPDWIVSMYPVTGLCDQSPDPNTSPLSADFSAATNPLIIQKSPPAPVTNPLVLSATQAGVCFTGMGAMTGDADCGLITTKIDIKPAQGTCKADGGDLRCLRVCISTGGLIRMCDPAVTDHSDPRYCSTDAGAC
ncbi:GspH/FimT family pseudopilin [Azospira inquinata]|uniref:GspH/FimT family pseudopilin n=1 Tax=Azospira inquinata TaxID=2785627 RepID=A0A975XV88_9RHOO|nr:GspH/FimT family pseudopilin [Azospira inquinata]QWT47648.1 GspH/FimT family pseudopilin [Azospira inquinata]QWT49592.1 GspH/FimT family pseudopilin [Azospira inquinata]